ncbi:hypothetical protein [Shewanella youngdeokensis]|uniref:Uncharacterized protein n=1 Tax=Shewanella youngdeokensis TaxID=2999068 RepID=A0ABZ0JYY6_9GAMM|nr:hypothetical protein RGE70_01365 [Shewanella sp. DAU334]
MANLQLKFSQSQTYFGGFGQLPEPISELKLVVSDPEKLAAELEQRLTIGAGTTKVELAKAG